MANLQKQKADLGLPGADGIWVSGNAGQGVWDFWKMIKMFQNRLVMVGQLHEYIRYH